MSERVILCIDDDITVLKILRKILTNEFHEQCIIATAENGMRGVDMVKAQLEAGNEIIVAISDFMMPGMTGDEFLLKLAELSPLTKRILLTGDKEHSINANTLDQMNLYRYLQKPIDKDDMLLTVNGAINSYTTEKQLHEAKLKVKDLDESIEQEVENRLKNAMMRKRYMEAIVDARLRFLTEITDSLNKNTPTLEVLLQFFKSIKTQINRRDKDRLAPGVIDTYKDIQDLIRWVQNKDTLFQPNTADFNVKQMVLKLLRANIDKAKDKRIDIDENINPELRVHADSHMVEMAFRAILAALIKITPAGENILCETEVNGPSAWLHMKNTKDDLDQNDLIQLFRNSSYKDEKITYLDDENKEIDLIVCNDFLEANNGSLVFKKVEEATRISLKFKASKLYVATQASIQTNEPTYDLKFLDVMIVDDNDINLLVIRKKLSVFGIDADSALSGLDALRLASKKTYDYIFLDIKMPDIDGYTTANKIREIQSKLGRLPRIIYQTAYVGDVNKEKMRESGVEMVISKPIRQEILEDIFRNDIKLFENKTEEPDILEQFNTDSDPNQKPPLP